jgi:saccharopine dehydrogenase-like NADP-dependent oxidoreductase
MRGALAARAHYLDLGGLFHMTRKQLKLDRAFRSIGRTAILGVGSSPGITNLLAVHAARGMERVSAVHCQVASVDRTVYRDAPPLGFGYSVDTLLDEFSMKSAVFRRGRTLLVPPLDPRENVVARFPKPIGPIGLCTTLHSEIATLPRHFAKRGVKEVTFRQGFDEDFMSKLRLLVELGLTSTEPLSKGGSSPRALLQASLARFKPARREGPLQRYEVLRAEVHGTLEGRKVVATADCHAPPEAGWGIGPDIDTGAPPSIVAQLLLATDPPPGVHAPEDAIPLAPFFRELKKREMRVTRTVRVTE